MDITIEKNVDRAKLVAQTSGLVDNLLGLMQKEKLSNDDYGKLKVARTAAPLIRAIVDIAQQETMMVRISLVAEKMKQMGYEEPKRLS